MTPVTPRFLRRMHGTVDAGDLNKSGQNWLASIPSGAAAIGQRFEPKLWRGSASADAAIGQRFEPKVWRGGASADAANCRPKEFPDVFFLSSLDLGDLTDCATQFAVSQYAQRS